VHDKNAPRLAQGWLNLGVPILGICYGLQLLATQMGGKVNRAKNREYGLAYLKSGAKKSVILKNVSKASSVWMSHGDSVVKLPEGFRTVASTETLNHAVIENPLRKIYALQFHPEVAHTEFGNQILANFLFDICHCKTDWTAGSFADQQIKMLKNRLGKSRVICALSGGVDSSVTATLLHKAIGKNLSCVFIDNGLLRLNEAQEVMQLYRKLRLNLKCIDASGCS
jgi:GMP synthase (glutamine-hydrolysing)